MEVFGCTKHEVDKARKLMPSQEDLIIQKQTISSAVYAKISHLARNMLLTGQKYGGMLKIDEHYVEKRARWCPTDNNLYGVLL